jgi:(4S)-4-hydroxy-5-phosphonooxypentane-2,3-dione isomerase
MMLMYKKTLILWEALILALLAARTLAFVAPSCGGVAGRHHANMMPPLYAATNKPFAVIVQAEIQPDRMDEFLQLIETNAVETRKEPGCVRFDVLRSHDADNKFFFYELYDGPEAIEYHKKQPHYNLWVTFKESGGVIVSSTYKTDGEFLT